MSTFSSTAGTVTSTLNAALNAANSLRNLLTWAANPKALAMPSMTPNRPKGVLGRSRPLPQLVGGSDMLDFSDIDD